MSAPSGRFNVRVSGLHLRLNCSKNTYLKVNFDGSKSFKTKAQRGSELVRRRPSYFPQSSSLRKSPPCLPPDAVLP